MIDPATWPRNTFPRDHAAIGEGYRLLEDFERLERGDETACISTLTSTQCHEGWCMIDGEWDDDIGKTIGELTQWGSPDIDHMERIFRRRDTKLGRIEARTFELTPQQRAAITKGLQHGPDAARL